MLMFDFKCKQLNEYMWQFLDLRMIINWMMFSIPISFVVTVVGTMVLTAFVYLKALFKPREITPKLYYKPSALTNHLMKRCRSLRRPFRPAGWADNSHVQTMLGFLLPCPSVSFHREYLQMKDRGVVALDWAIPKSSKLAKSSPVLIVLTGIADDAVSGGALCDEGSNNGYRVVVFNKRGHGGSVLTTPMLQSFGDPSDLRQVIKYIRDRFPKAMLTGVGVSSGSALLVSYLGEFGSSCYLSAAVCISPGYDAYRFFNTKQTGIYDFFLLLGLKWLLSKHSTALSKVIDVPKALRTNNIIEFDKAVYCQLYGYSSLQEYWERNNPMRDVDDIAVPILCLNSLDDPVYLKESIPFDLFKAYPNFLLVSTEKGGHCGFLEGSPPKPWAYRLSVDYLSTVLEFLTIHGDK